jgi:hypothetical protein
MGSKRRNLLKSTNIVGAVMGGSLIPDHMNMRKWKMKRSTGATLLLVTLLIVTFVIPLTVSAQESLSFYWDSINVDIDVQGNGDMLVTETYKYVFTAPFANERYRWIPLDSVDDIVDIEVHEEGRIIPAITGVENGQLWIRWNPPSEPPESNTFLLKYRVIGGLHIHESGDQIYWKAIARERNASVMSANVTVRLPASVSGEQFKTRTYGVAAVKRTVDGRTIEFTTGRIPEGKELEVQVIFQHGLLDIPAPVWQQGVTQRAEQSREALGNVASRLIAPMLGAFLLVALALWKTRKWSFYYPSVSHEVDAPPSDLPAPAVSLLESRKVSAHTIISTVVEMCQRGTFTVEVKQKGALLWKSREYYLVPHGSSVLESDQVAKMVMELMKKRDTWEGTPAELLTELDHLADNRKIYIGKRGWPKRPADLTRKLKNKIKPNIGDAGLTVEIDGSRDKAKVRIAPLQEGIDRSVPIAADRVWEKILLVKIYRRAKVSNLQLHTLRDGMGDDLGEYLQSRGLFTENPVQVWKERSLHRFGWRALGILASIILGIGIGLWLALLISPEVGTVVGMQMFVFGAGVSYESSERVGKIAPSPAGSDEMSEWRAFRKHLLSITSDRELTEEQFNSYLPHVIALGNANAWLEKAANAQISTPSWFHYPKVQPDAGSSSATLADAGDAFQGFLDSVGRSFKPPSS